MTTQYPPEAVRGALIAFSGIECTLIDYPELLKTTLYLPHKYYIVFRLVSSFLKNCNASLERFDKDSALCAKCPPRPFNVLVIW